MKTHCVQQVLALCCAVTESINGEQAWCQPAHQLSSVSWLEKPTSSPSFYSESAKCWKSSCEPQPHCTSKHRHCSCVHQEVPVTKWPLCLTCIPCLLGEEWCRRQLATSWRDRWALINYLSIKTSPEINRKVTSSINFQWYLNNQTLERSLDGSSNDQNSFSHEKHSRYSNTTGATRQWWTDPKIWCHCEKGNKTLEFLRWHVFSTKEVPFLILQHYAKL